MRNPRNYSILWKKKKKKKKILRGTMRTRTVHELQGRKSRASFHACFLVLKLRKYYLTFVTQILKSRTLKLSAKFAVRIVARFYNTVSLQASTMGFDFNSYAHCTILLVQV
jgi:hypothetical protein